VWAVAGMLFVADTGNHRVLIWNEIPIINGTPADLVLGQANFTGGSPGLSDSRLNRPTDVWSDGEILAVADEDNNRVLIWNEVPDSNGAPADIVVGQPDFTSSTAASTRLGLNQPQGVYSNGLHLFVSDSGNNRVLIYNAMPAANRPEADVVLGQPDFVENTPGTTSQLMKTPTGASIIGNHLFVADSGNARVLIFDGE